MPALFNVCKLCTRDESKSWWKCCPGHTTEKGVDVVCEDCASRCMNKKEMTQVVNAVFLDKTMSFFYMCDNEECRWFGQIRQIEVFEIAPDWYNKPNPICRCGHYPRPVLENE